MKVIIHRDKQTKKIVGEFDEYGRLEKAEKLKRRSLRSSRSTTSAKIIRKPPRSWSLTNLRNFTGSGS